MSDVVVTVPMRMWEEWIAEGDLPGEPESDYVSHFWIPRFGPQPKIEVGERVYIVAHGKLRGYAPLTGVEASCRLNRSRACLLRRGDAVAVTIPDAVWGFQGWRYRWWDRDVEVAFPDWMTP